MKHVWFGSIRDETWMEVFLSTSVPQRYRIARHTEIPVRWETRLCQEIIDEIRERR